jgi:hypothetical protein
MNKEFNSAVSSLVNSMAVYVSRVNTREMDNPEWCHALMAIRSIADALIALAEVND